MINTAQYHFNLQKALHAVCTNIEATAERELLLNQIQLQWLLSA
jgi:hypothetical protein